MEEELRMAEARSWDFDCESTVYEWGSMVWMSEGESSEEEMLGFLLFTERERERVFESFKWKSEANGALLWGKD